MGGGSPGVIRLPRAGVGIGVGKGQKAAEGGIGLFSSACCRGGPPLAVEPCIGSTMFEALTLLGIASSMAASGEATRGGRLAKAARGKGWGASLSWVRGGTEGEVVAEPWETECGRWLGRLHDGYVNSWLIM